MSKRAKKTIKEVGGLEEYLESCSNSKILAGFHGGRSLWSTYQEIKTNLCPIQEEVVTGALVEALASGREECNRKLEEVCSSKDSTENILRKVSEIISEDYLIFLNDHGPSHVEKVIEKANQILTKNTMGPELSEAECFILLCAIQIHDIGSIYGRNNHEKKTGEMLAEKSTNIITDKPELRVIENVAMVHGGKIKGSKDTISKLPESETICDQEIRPRLLAAILRFADELADDLSRANTVALEMDLIGDSSKIFHVYSKALHTVKLSPIENGLNHEVQLVYELQVDDLREKYKYNKVEKYLLDEIYDRTLKMERERRYCSKFLYSFIRIGKINVRINIYGEDSLPVDNISYTLEDVSYPNDLPLGGIKDINNQIPSGEEEFLLLIGGAR